MATPIRTYGKRSLTLNLGLCRSRSLPIIADVQKPILGADDMSHSKLVDTQGIHSAHSSLSATLSPKDTYLSDFLSLTQVAETQHFPPLQDHQPQPAPERKFEHMLHHQTVPGPPHSTWFLRRLLVTGTPVVTTASA